MEAYEKEAMKRIRRHSQSVLHDLLIRGFKDEVKDVSVIYIFWILSVDAWHNDLPSY